MDEHHEDKAHLHTELCFLPPYLADVTLNGKSRVNEVLKLMIFEIFELFL